MLNDFAHTGAMNKVIVHVTAIDRETGEAVIRCAKIDKGFESIVEEYTINQTLVYAYVERCGAV